MPRLMQYVDCIHFTKIFAPLLELHAAQHNAMFSGVMIDASLMMCSHVATALREPRDVLLCFIRSPQ